MRRPLSGRGDARQTLGPLQKAMLSAEVIFTYGRARRLLRRADLPTALAALRKPAGARGADLEDPVLLGRRLAHSTTRTLAALPADSRCLMQALTLTGLLARRRLASDLLISVRPGEAFAAHAWVEHAGEPLLPADSPGHERLVKL